MKKILLIFSSAVMALTARGNTIVFSDFGPGDTYNQFAGYSVVMNPEVLQEVGAQFTAGASGNLATVDLGLTYQVAGAVNAYLYGDAGGSPDNANQTFLGSGTPTAVFGTTNNSLVSFAVAGTIPVTMGTTYWLVLKPAGAIMLDDWNWSSPAVAGNTALSSTDLTWTVASGTLPAFRLTASGPVQGVPDTGATFLLLLWSVATLLAFEQMLSRQHASQ
jgi:hypothetical protein